LTDGETAGSRYRVVHDLAVRLIKGEIIHLTDEHARRWRATRHALFWILDSGECATVVEGDAFDVAARLAGLLPRSGKAGTSRGPSSL
jgi:hypothetical protein